MIRIALLRHFPTDWNAEARLQGRADRPLTPEARARLAGLGLPPPWDGAALVSSPLSRAVETACALGGGRRVPRLNPDLVEQDWGLWEGRRAVDLIADPSSGFVPTHRLGPGDRPPGGETRDEVLHRALRALARIDRQSVIVTHKGVMRALLAAAGAPAQDDGAVAIRRARLYPLSIGRDGAPCDPGPPIRLMRRI